MVRGRMQPNRHLDRPGRGRRWAEQYWPAAEEPGGACPRVDVTANVLTQANPPAQITGGGAPSNQISRNWPNDANGKVPYSRAIRIPDHVLPAELERIWYGPHWLFCALEAEIPEIGDFKTTTLGERPVIVIRSGPGEVSVLENRCAHRGVKFCQARKGHVKDLVCPYHQWNYSLRGDLQGAPFRRGVRGQGGMPADFDPKNHGLRNCGWRSSTAAVWATFSDGTPPFGNTSGSGSGSTTRASTTAASWKSSGYNRQHIPGNWKLMQENIKDPYHASLLHVFFVTFGLFRADQKSATEVDPDRAARHPDQPHRRAEVNGLTSGMRTFRNDIRLADPRILDVVHEFPGEDTVGMITVFPSVVLQQNGNSLSIRHIVPTGPGGFDFHWTHWCYADDTPEMRRRRTRQANLFGPAGLRVGR